MPSPLPIPSLFAATHALLALRVQVTRRTLERSPAAQTASVLALLLVCPAALQIGKRAAHLMATTSPEAFPALCTALVLLTLLYVALLLAGNAGLGGVMESPPETVLRALPVPPVATLLADAVCFVVSLPTLFFLIAVMPLVTGWQSAFPLALLGGSAAIFALLLGRIALWLTQRGRNSLIFATLALILLGGVILRAAPAAALSSAIADKDQRPSVRLPWDPPPPPPPPIPALLRNSPPGLVAQAIYHPKQSALPLTVFGSILALVCAGAVSLDHLLRHTEPRIDDVSSRRGNTGRIVDPLRIEARLLVRNPGAHTLLRGPASLLLTIGYAWMAPNLGGDAVRNLGDLLGIGVTLYIALWQIQFVCNRFGSDAGRAATLFSLPTQRARLLVNKNTMLLVGMLSLDGIVLAGFAIVAGNPRLIPTLLMALPAVLVPLTALGNIVSVLAPFPLPRKTERYEREPERSLLFVYILVGIGTGLLFLPVQWLWNTWGVTGYLLGLVYVAALYAASIGITARLLTLTRERQLIALLDGTK